MLHGNSITLRPLKKTDISLMNVWRNDLELIKLTQGYRLPKTIEMDEDWYNRVLRDTNAGSVYFGIEENESGELVGMVQLNNIDYISRTAIWGLVIGDRTKQGKGFSREIVGLFLDYAFNTLNLRKLWGYMISCNEGARKMHERIGSVFEGTLKDHVFYDGQYYDVIIASLYKESYLKKGD